MKEEFYTNEQIIERYQTYLRKHKKSNEDTIRNYIYDIKAFNIYLNDKHFYDVTEEDIKAYIQDKKSKRLSASRINFGISTLSSFYKYLVRNRYTNYNPIENIKTIKIKKKKEVESIGLPKVYDIRHKLRDNGNLQLEVFFALLISGMPKRCMISNILWKNINWKKSYIIVEINENESGLIYLDQYTLDVLAKLRKERKEKNIKRKWVFITRHNGNWKSVTSNTITNWVDKIREIGKLEELSFAILKKTTLKYWRFRNFSQEKIDKLISYRSFPTEIKSYILEEFLNVVTNK